MSDLEFTSLRKNDELQGSDNRLPVPNNAAPNRSLSFSRPSLTRVKSCFNDVRECRCSTRIVVFAGLIILGVCYFALVGITTEQAKEAANAPVSLAVNPKASNKGWTVVYVQGVEAKNLKECPIAVDWNPQYNQTTTIPDQTNSLVLELEWQKLAASETNGGSGSLVATIILPDTWRDKNLGPISNIPFITVTCTFLDMMYSVSVEPSSSENLFQTETFAIPFPKGSFRFFPLDFYDLEDLTISCFAKSGNPFFPVKQVNHTTGEYYGYPIIPPDSQGVTTTGAYCPKKNIHYWADNRDYYVYDCPPNQLPVFLSYILKIKKSEATSSSTSGSPTSGSFAHINSITQPSTAFDCVGVVATLSTNMFRPVSQQFLPIVFTIGTILLFFGNLASNFPVLYGAPVHATMIGTAAGLIFSQGQLWAAVGAGTSTSTLLFNSSYYWIQLLNMFQFFFISYKFMRQLWKEHASKAARLARNALFKKNGGGAGDAHEASAYDDEDAEKNV